MTAENTKVVVLGAGIVGSVLAADLAEGGWAVTVCDRRASALGHAEQRSKGKVATQRLDLADADAIKNLVEPFDFVVDALPGVLGYAALRAIIEAGKDCCDISFMPEDQRRLDGLARERGVTAVVDCGVAPGLSNLLAGHAASRLEPCTRIAIYVGGLPRARVRPFEYKAAFSPSDVIDEYVRPARFKKGGRLVTVEALAQVELIDLPEVGTLEAFLTDGLRSLVDTLDVPSMVEKTLRYPGHARLMHAFRETGLFDRAPVRVRGKDVIPRELLETLLFPKWTFAEGEEDLTVMRVVAEGERNGAPARLAWNLLDRYDVERGWSSMARTTGFPAAIFARLVAAGRIEQKGIVMPEALGADAALVEHVLAELARRGVRVEGGG